MAEVFISYSRKDKAFVQSLHAALQTQNRTTWVDWSNIPLTADWWQEIERGIEAADTFVVVLSLDAIASTICRKEIDHAIQHHKRLVPVVHRDDFSAKQAHEGLRKLNWLYFREQDDFTQAFAALLHAIDTDLEHVQQHTRLLVKAIEWEENNRDDSFLLRGNGLAETEQWLAQTKDKEPQSTALQMAYVIASEEWQRQEIQRLQNLYEQAERRRVEAEKNEVRALCQSSEARFNSAQAFEALLDALQAVQQLETATWSTNDLQEQVRLVLQQAVYGVQEQNRLETENSLAFVKSVSYSPDNTLIVSGINIIVDGKTKGQIILWKADGQQLGIIGEHDVDVVSVCFSPDGRMIASADWNGCIKIRTVEGEVLNTIHNPTALWAVHFSPDGLMLISGGEGAVRFWSLEGQELQVLPTIGYVTSLAISPDGQTIAAAGGIRTGGGGDGFIKVWSLDGRELQTLEGHIAPVMAVCFNPDGKMIASSGWDRKIKLWSLEGQELQSINADNLGNQGSCETVFDVKFSPDGSLLAAATKDGLVKLWSREGQGIRFFKGHDGGVRSLSFCANGAAIASGSSDGTIRIWSLHDQELLTLMEENTDGFLNVSFSPDEQWIVATSHNGTISLWDRSGQLQQTFRGHNNCVNGISFSPDSQTFATASNHEKVTVKLWNLKGQELQQFIGHYRGVSSVCFSPDGRTLMSVGWEDQTIRLWNLQGHLLMTMDGAYSDAEFSPDGEIIASADGVGNLMLWNRAGEKIKTLRGHQDTIRRIQFSPDSQVIATASDDKTIKLWSISGEEINTLKGHRGPIGGLSFSPDGQTIASASADKTIKLWNLAGQELKTLRGHGNSVSAVCFSPDGKAIASASMDSTVKLWNAETLGFDALVERGRHWIENYLRTNPKVRLNR